MNKLIEILRGKRKDKKGFTLMEMLIVVAIIAILVAIAVPTFNSSLDKARKAADDANIKTAYMESILHTEDPDLYPGEVKVDGKKITFSDGSDYTLKYYESIDETAGKQWKGVKN